jgi:CRP-like cAMP-binding protein
VPAGWICGFSVGGNYDASCDALTDATAIAYQKTEIDKIDWNEDRRRIAHQLERQICALHDHGLLLSRKSAEERVAAFLIRFVSGRGVPNCAGPSLTDDSAAIDIPMGGREIGDFLGLNAETVSRAITKLERGGLIARVQGKRNNYRITDVCRLCQAAHNDCGL